MNSLFNGKLTESKSQAGYHTDSIKAGSSSFNYHYSAYNNHNERVISWIKDLN